MLRIVLPLVLFFASATAGMAQARISPEEMAVKIADRIVSSTTYNFVDRSNGKVYTSLKNVPLKKEIVVESKYTQWHYTNGVTNLALMELGNELKTKKYENYVLKNMNFVFNEGHYDYYKRLFDQEKAAGGWRAVRPLSWHMIHRNKRLDDNGPMGASLIELQKNHKHPNFQKYIDATADHIRYSEPRMADGTIARIWPHDKTIWADDAFMAISFMARMGEATGDDRWFTDAANQVLNYTKYLWFPEKQLYIHCYHTDTDEHGVAHWSRANGWVYMAQADLLKVMPKDHPLREQVLNNFRMQTSGIARYQGKNGLWHQVLDRVDSYEEITGTAMFTFGIARGVKEGWLHPDFIYVADMGLRGIMSKITPEGDVTSICVGTGIMPSLKYYYDRPTQTNDPMGEGPVLRALIEMINAPRYTEVGADEQYDKIP